MNDFNKLPFNPGPAFIGAVIAVIAGVIILVKSVVVIPAGHVGVMDLFGKVSEKSLPAGLHFINPLKKVTKLSIQTREIKETAEVPSKEGLVVTLDVSLLFSLDPLKAPGQTQYSVDGGTDNPLARRCGLQGPRPVREARAVAPSSSNFVINCITPLRPQRLLHDVDRARGLVDDVDGRCGRKRSGGPDEDGSRPARRS